eukprot:g7601.t1
MFAPAKKLKDLQLSQKPATQHETPEQVEAAGEDFEGLPKASVTPTQKRFAPVEVEFATTMPKTVGNLVCRPVLDAVRSLSSACFYTESKNLVGNFVFAGHVCSSLLFVTQGPFRHDCSYVVLMFCLGSDNCVFGGGNSKVCNEFNTQHTAPPPLESGSPSNARPLQSSTSFSRVFGSDHETTSSPSFSRVFGFDHTSSPSPSTPTSVFKTEPPVSSLHSTLVSSLRIIGLDSRRSKKAIIGGHARKHEKSGRGG